MTSESTERVEVGEGGDGPEIEALRERWETSVVVLGREGDMYRGEVECRASCPVGATPLSSGECGGENPPENPPVLVWLELECRRFGASGPPDCEDNVRVRLGPMFGDISAAGSNIIGRSARSVYGPGDAFLRESECSACLLSSTCALISS